MSVRLRRKALLDSLGRTAASSIEKFTEVVQRHLVTMGFVVTNLSKVDTSEKMYRLDIYNVYHVYMCIYIYVNVQKDLVIKCGMTLNSIRRSLLGQFVMEMTSCFGEELP